MPPTATKSPELSASAAARSHVDAVRSANADFYGDARGRGALKDLQQTFPHTWLYIAELLQNAIDAGCTRIRVESDNAGNVDFEHDGNAFSAGDVKALCER